MSATDVKDIVRSSFERISAKDLEGLQDLLADGFVLHEQDDQHDVRGRDGAAEYFHQYFTAFPDMKVEINGDILVDGDTAAVRWTMRGTHEGELSGIKPTGRTIEVHGIEIDRVKDGKLVETWQNWDSMSLFQQLGVVPSEQELVGTN